MSLRRALQKHALTSRLGGWLQRRAMAPLLRRLWAPPQGLRVLDVGAGAGDAARAWLGALGAAHVTLLDHDPALLRRAARRLKRQTDASHFTLLEADAHALPLPAATLDAVLLNHLLTHVKNPTRVLTESARVLKPGGIVYVAELLSKHQANDALTQLLHEAGLTVVSRLEQPLLPGLRLLLVAARAEATQLELGYD